MRSVRSAAKLLFLNAALLCTLALPTALRAQQLIPALTRHGVRFDADALAAIELGDAVAKTIPTADQRDVAVIGAVRLDVSREEYLRRTRDLRSWLRAPTREHVGVFSVPATLADVAELEVSPKDASELRKCRAGSCTTKLSSAEMARVQEAVDWSARDVPALVTRMARQRLVKLVEEYRERGNAALPVFEDRMPGVRAVDAFEAVLTQSRFLQQVAPEVAAHLRSYPRDRLAGTTDQMYWAESVVSRLRPILSLTHTVIHPAVESAGWTVVASKQLYANHYFEAALEVVDVVDRTSAGEAPGVYLVIERRFRFDNLPGGLLNIRGKAANGLRDQLLADLRRERLVP